MYALFRDGAKITMFQPLVPHNGHYVVKTRICKPNLHLALDKIVPYFTKKRKNHSERKDSRHDNSTNKRRVSRWRKF